MREGSSGFTLLEVMVATAVLALVVALGAPAFDGLMTRARTANAAHLVTASFAQARMEAIRRNRTVTVCPTRDGRTCRRDLDWSEGWLLFVGASADAHPIVPIAVVQERKSLILKATSGRPLIRFRPDGQAEGSNVTLRICDRDGRQLLAEVVLSNSGRTRTARPDGRRCPS
jgi:type IV fimbrial biogenesis protein FimT